MSPRDNGGAIPLADLAEAKSDVHHLRSQADLDRRALADLRSDVRSLSERSEDRHIELKIYVTTLDSMTKQIGSVVQRVELRQQAEAHTLKEVRDVQIEQRGGARVMKWLISLVGGAQLLHWCWELTR
jgi:hypothetical protein